MSDTPETDAATHDLSDYGPPVPCSWGDWVAADYARKLERERDEARTTIEDAKRALNATDYEGILLAAMRVKDERDEARAERDILRLDAQREAEHHDRMVGELQRLYAKLEEARAIADELADIASKHLSFLLAVTPAKTNETHEKETMRVIDAIKRWKKL
jgi:hypothetical protein